MDARREILAPWGLSKCGRVAVWARAPGKLVYDRRVESGAISRAETGLTKLVVCPAPTRSRRRVMRTQVLQRSSFAGGLGVVYN